jgi:hypothetical protein
MPNTIDDIIKRLRDPSKGSPRWGDTMEEAADEIERLWLGYTTLNSEVCQRLGKALGYPWFKDDQENFPGATEESGVCTGEHVAESIAAEAARRIGNLEAERDRLRRLVAYLLAERDRLREALAPLKQIADCYDANCLDAEARRFWGPDHDRRENSRDPAEIELYTGRGGARLLTLAACFKARAALKETGREADQ